MGIPRLCLLHNAQILDKSSRIPIPIGYILIRMHFFLAGFEKLKLNFISFTFSRARLTNLDPSREQCGEEQDYKGVTIITNLASQL